MITSVADSLFPILCFIFNFILSHSIFPTAWITTLINAIFKNNGSRLLAIYYRPVSLVHMSSKLFNFILLSRFKKWFFPVDEQSAYQPGRSCADNIFLIRCLINLAKRSKTKLFLVAVDFEGAFDCVNRSHLFKKLVKFGAGAAFILHKQESSKVHPFHHTCSCFILMTFFLGVFLVPVVYMKRYIY